MAIHVTQRHVTERHVTERHVTQRHVTERHEIATRSTVMTPLALGLSCRGAENRERTGQDFNGSARISDKIGLACSKA